ncbi:hypothetical protein V8F33_004407 [Rhypophila sp. PSN 637]
MDEYAPQNEPSSWLDVTSVNHHRHQQKQQQQQQQQQQHGQCLICDFQPPQPPPRPQQDQELAKLQARARSTEELNRLIKWENRIRLEMGHDTLLSLLSIETGRKMPNFPRTLDELEKLDVSQVNDILRQLGIIWYVPKNRKGVHCYPWNYLEETKIRIRMLWV